MDTKFTVMGINTALHVIEQCTAILKVWTTKEPDDPTKRALSDALESVDESLRLAKSEIAQGYDYPLCLMHFPPGIMVKTKSDGELVWWRCSDCGALTGEKEAAENMRHLAQRLRERYPRLRVQQITLEQAKVLRQALRHQASSS